MRAAVLATAAARERIVAALAAHIDVVAIDHAQVALVDVPDVRTLATAIEAAGDVPAIVLVTDPHPEIAATAVRAGAAAVLARMSDERELRAAIGAVAAGLIVVDGAARDAFSAAAPANRSTGPDALTPRERDVLALLARGLSNKRIAARLGVSEHTVKFHVASVLAKLGAATRAEAVARGMRGGYVLV